jgi:large subunit ribosomal protein L30
MPSNEKTNAIRIQLVRSPIGYNKGQQAVLKSLGFHKLNSVVVHSDTPTIRGMVNKVRHLVAVEGEVSAAGIEFFKK